MEKSILFNAEMVRAIEAGNKTQTRRVVKSKHGFFVPDLNPDRQEDPHWPVDEGTDNWIKCPYGEVGDRLWVGETFAQIENKDFTLGRIIYKADGWKPVNPEEGDPLNWKSPIHMPRKHSRITLEVVDIRVERVQDITEKDAHAEGTEVPLDVMSMYRGMYKASFKALWDSINGKKEGCSWEANPWVWVVEFKRVEGEK